MKKINCLKTKLLICLIGKNYTYTSYSNIEDKLIKIFKKIKKK